MTTTLYPLSRRRETSHLEVGLLPLPVREAQTLMRGLLGLIIVSLGPSRTKLAPAAWTSAALSWRYIAETSL